MTSVLRVLASLLITLHGLVHLWFVLLAQRVVEFKPEMGWSGESWLLTAALGDGTTRSLASLLLLMVTVGLTVGGIGYLMTQGWASPLLSTSALISAMTLIAFWDGSIQLLVQKGLIGVLIDVAIVLTMVTLP